MIATLFCIAFLATLAAFMLLVLGEVVNLLFRRDPQKLANHIVKTKRAILRQMERA